MSPWWWSEMIPVLLLGVEKGAAQRLTGCISEDDTEGAGKTEGGSFKW